MASLTRRVVRIITAAVVMALIVILVTPRPAYSATRSVTGYDSVGPIRAYGSAMCLTLVSNHPNQKIDWAPCAKPITADALQIWEAQVISGSMIIFLAANPRICLDGAKHAGEYVYSYDC